MCVVGVHAVDRRCGRRLAKVEGGQTSRLEGRLGQRDVIEDVLRSDVGVVRVHARSVVAR